MDSGGLQTSECEISFNLKRKVGGSTTPVTPTIKLGLDGKILHFTGSVKLGIAATVAPSGASGASSASDGSESGPVTPSDTGTSSDKSGASASSDSSESGPVTPSDTGTSSDKVVHQPHPIVVKVVQ